MTGVEFLLERGFKLSLLILFILLLLDPHKSGVVLVAAGDSFPVINVTTWLGNVDDRETQWKNDVFNDLDQEGAVTLVNGSTYIVTNEVVCICFLCTAPYPIEWEFSHSKWMLSHENTLGSYAINTRRIANDMDNPRTFVYQAQIAFVGDSRLYNGKYTCKSSSNPSKQRNITLFWEGGPFDAEFVMSGKNVSVWLEKDRIVFPCHVDNPFANVSLQKENQLANQTDQWIPVTLSPQLEFIPEMGFIFHKTTVDWMDPGNYRCITNDETDYVLINLIPDVEPDKILDSPIRSNATFDRNAASRFECCSKSATPPTLLIHRCGDPTTCEKMIPALKQQVTNGQGHNSVMHLFGFPYKTNGSCTSINNAWGQSFDIQAVQCFGDGINVYKQFFQPNPKNLSFDKWGKTNLEQWIEIGFVLPHGQNPNPIPKKVQNKTSTVETYLGQTNTFFCKAPQYFFSYGFRFSTKNKDGTNQVIPDTFDAFMTRLRSPFKVLLQTTPLQMTIDIKITSELASLTCHVPVWNTSEWITKTIYFSTKVPEPPSIEGSDNTESIFWTLNETDKSLTCRTKGDPEPHVIWMKDNQVGTGSLYNVSRHNDGSYILRIPTVTHEIQGEFKCISVNVAGRKEKTFLIYVEESQVAEITTIIIVTVIILLVIIGGAFLFHKTFIQKKILDNLREYVYPAQDQSHSSGTA